MPNRLMFGSLIHIKGGWAVENYRLHELTAVSLNPVVPQPPERRSEERATTLLRAGKLVVDGEQQLCMIRNISSAGAMLKLWRTLPEGQRIQVEITPDCPVSATVIWTQGDLVGVAFDQRIDVANTLTGQGHAGPYRRIARTPRLRTHCPARIGIEAREWAVVLSDVSLNGARIATEEALSRDEEVTLSIAGLVPVSGRVRWCRDGHAGIEFDRPMPLDVLASWVASAGGRDCAALAG